MSTLATRAGALPTHADRHAGSGAKAETVPASSAPFDWTATLLCAVFLGGLFLDGWAHTHGRVDETFFTPWHAVLYSGFLATAVFLCAGAGWGALRGRSWHAALPDGYGLSLLGVGLWVVGGPFDFAWHVTFGFEADVEALMSPAHVLLALGFSLMASGPLRAGLRRPPGPWHRDVTMVLSLAFVVSALTFFTQIAHPLANLWADGRAAASADKTELGLVSLLLTTVIVVGPALLLLRHRRLPAGGLTIVVALNSLAMGFLYDHGDYPVAPTVALVAAGAGADVLRLLLRVDARRPGAFRLYAFAVPVLLNAAYFASLGVTVGIGWSAHLWIGAIVFCGIVGWLLSYLTLAPRLHP